MLLMAKGFAESPIQKALLKVDANSKKKLVLLSIIILMLVCSALTPISFQLTNMDSMALSQVPKETLKTLQSPFGFGTLFTGVITFSFVKSCTKKQKSLSSYGNFLLVTLMQAKTTTPTRREVDSLY